MTRTPRLERLVYASRSASPKSQRANDVRHILEVARARNTALEISGLLTVSEQHYLQLLEGPPAAVRALFEKIAVDRRHQEVELLGIYAAETRAFPNWSMGLVERAESEKAAAQRLQELKARLSGQGDFSAADFFRFMLTPGGALPLQERTQRPSDVVFCSPSGLWGPAVLDRVIAGSTLRAGRTALVPPDGSTAKALVEYVDAHINGYGPVRTIALPSAALNIAAVRPLISRLSLVVLLLSLSDLPQLPAYVDEWTTLTGQDDLPPDFLIVSNLSIDQVETRLAELTLNAAHVSVARARLSDAAAIWEATCTHLRTHAPRAAPGEKPLPSVARYELNTVDNATATAITPLAQTETLSSAAHAPPKECAQLLTRLLSITGVLQAAVVEVASLELHVLQPLPTLDLSWAAEFVRAQHALAARLAPSEALSEVVVTTSAHLLVFMNLAASTTARYALLLVDRAETQLGAVRLKMQEMMVDAGLE